MVGNSTTYNKAKEISKMLIASLIMSILVIELFKIVSPLIGNNVAVIVVSTFGAFVYFLIAYVLRVKECLWVLSLGTNYLRIHDNIGRKEK